jgi:pimeloyl-ACP methyl ester carboxylesterase
VRLIAFDRPGFGQSSPQPDRQIGDWALDVREAAEQLGVPRFDVLGVSGGGPYAAACAAKLPDLVSRAAIVSGWAPADKSAATSGLPWFTRMTLALWRRIPALVHLAIWWLALNAKLFPALVLLAARRRLPAVDQEIYQRPNMRTMERKVLREVFRQGHRGPAHELVLFSQRWDFRVEDIRVPVLLWHGDADRTVPISMGRYMASAIPDCTATYYPGQGHYMSFDRMDTILAALVA